MPTSGQPSDRELAALADGSLAPAERDEVEAAVRADPALNAALEEQRAAVAALRTAGARVRAPLSLRERIEADRRRLAPRARRRRAGLAGALATGLAAAALVLALTLPGGTPGGPTVVRAAGLGALPPTIKAPKRRDGSKVLAAALDGVPYPYWGDAFGWETAGLRRDRLDGRRAVTVFYEKGGRRIGYTIVSGRPLQAPADAESEVYAGTRLRSYVRAGRAVVTWLRGGRTCVLSGAGVPREALLRLAAWRGRGGVPF